MSLWKYLELPEYFRQMRERNDPEIDKSLDVNTNQYPNYEMIPNYNYKPELIPGYHLLIGGSYGFLFSVFVGLPYIQRKYRRLGYRDWKLMEKLCIPLFKSSILFTFVGIGCGALLEIRRIANQDFQKDYNKKVF